MYMYVVESVNNITCMLQSKSKNICPPTIVIILFVQLYSGTVVHVQL